MPETDLNRRRFLRRAGLAGAAVVVPVGAGFVGYSLPRSEASTEQQAAATNSAADETPEVHHFVSREDLQPPRLVVADAAGDDEVRGRVTEPTYLLLCPKGYQASGPGQQGLMLVNRQGQPVWLLPLLGEDEVPMDFKVQTYRGEPVLTWWQGVSHGGHGTGKCVIYNSSYEQIGEVQTGDDRADSDLHEFLITDDDTALVVAYQPHEQDLTSVGGSKRGWVSSGLVQEIDIATGEVLFEWDSLDHVGIDETEQELGEQGTKDAPFDYFHINSVEVDTDGDLLISARNTWALYKIARDTGEVRWRLGGTKSDFDLADDARFYWQHDARRVGPDRIGLFDNASSPPKEKRSRGLILDVDMRAKKVTVARAYPHPSDLLADNQGSMQVLPDGRAIVGWGAQPYISEFTEGGELLTDWRMPAPDQTYRAAMHDWVGRPKDKPVTAIRRNNARGFLVYVTWNGATEVRQWRILAGATAEQLDPVTVMPRSGFETAIAVNDPGPHFVAVALDKDGQELGRSEVNQAKE